MDVVARESWTDERLDDFKELVNQRFDEVDRHFDRVENRLDRIDGRLDSLNKTLVQGFIALATVQIAGFAAMLGLVATQL
jgi:tetrahydromethanopterin S-methyltransferase subunit G